MGIAVLPPDVNESEANFTAVGTDIRFGLTAVRNVGRNVVDGIVAGRTEIGKAVSFHGFLDAAPLVVCNKRVIESLIKAGAFDSLGDTRRSLLAVYDRNVDEIIDIKRNEAIGQDDLFGGDDGDERPDADARSRTCRSGTSGPSSRSSGRCSGCTSPITPCRASSTSCSPSGTSRSGRCWPTTVRATAR